MNRKEEYLLKRRRKGITHNELAKVLGCSQSTISRFERDLRDISEEKIKKYETYIDTK